MTAPEWVDVDQYGPIPCYWMQCLCREWLIAPMFGWGRCGLCWDRPT